ncbi:CDCP1 protein, partial [Amia calva]|nr:CDCP1 protein [Amia calva]
MKCHKEITLKGGPNVSVEFTCAQPQDVFTVAISKNIGKRFNHDSLFMDFNRTLHWDIKGQPKNAFQVDFSGYGLRQILPSESCPDLQKYTVVAYQRVGLTRIGMFCKGGMISKIQVLYKGRVSLQVPGNALNVSNFEILPGPVLKRLAIIEVNLKPESSVTFMSPNYPEYFPDDDYMTWKFSVPRKNNATVQFLHYTEPSCVKKDAEVEYHRTNSNNNNTLGKSLGEEQPSHMQQDFTMSLNNCEDDKSSSVGLSLKFEIIVIKSHLPVLSTVDLEKSEGLTIQIDKTNPASDCEIKADSVIMQNITLQSGNKFNLSFQDCMKEDVILTITKTIECLTLKGCPVSAMPLAVPTLEPSLPISPQRITWHLRPPENGTVELKAQMDGLQQSLPGYECNQSFSYTLTEPDGSNIGTFCSSGSINKVQIHSDMSIVMTANGVIDLSQAQQPIFNVSFTKDIQESYIFTVTPKVGVATLLATPNWPVGMKPSAMVSWIVSLPRKTEADLGFLNISQPKCSQGNTQITALSQGSGENLFSLREDESAKSQLSVDDSFWLKMSNCQPESQQPGFSVLSKITLQKKSNLLLNIILGAVGALLFILLIVLIVVCVVLRKKKQKQKENQMAIYNPNVNTFFPGHSLFPKTRADNESHIYADIEDTMVYGHLLNEIEGGPPQVDTYRTFTGPMDDTPVSNDGKDSRCNPEVDVYRPFISLSEAAPGAAGVLGRGNSLAYMDRRMVDNELYTFKSNGDASPLPPPPLMEPIADTDKETEEAV